MANRLLKPYDPVDLSVLAQSFGDVLPTLYPVAYAYDPLNNLVDGAPFTLSNIGNNLYALNNAFQAKVDSGTYKIIYIFYTDAEHTIRSTNNGEEHETITISIQAVSGPGAFGGGGDFLYDDSPLRKMFSDEMKKMKKSIDKLQKDFDAGLKMDVKYPAIDISPIISRIESMNAPVNNAAISKDIRRMSQDLMSAIKKNRSVVIKSAFDKKMLSPMLEVVAETKVSTISALNDMKIGMIKTIDMKNNDFTDRFIGEFDKIGDKMLKVMNGLNESIRVKMKYLLDTLIMKNFTHKQDINITLKSKDQEL